MTGDRADVRTLAVDCGGGGIKANVLDNPKVEAIFGLHVTSIFSTGRIVRGPGPADRVVAAGRGGKVAFLWEGEPGDKRTLTYWDLYVEVRKFANVLAKARFRTKDGREVRPTVRFLGLWEHNKTREIPEVERVGAWLTANMPQQTASTTRAPEECPMTSTVYSLPSALTLYVDMRVSGLSARRSDAGWRSAPRVPTALPHRQRACARVSRDEPRRRRARRGEGREELRARR